LRWLVLLLWLLILLLVLIPLLLVLRGGLLVHLLSQGRVAPRTVSGVVRYVIQSTIIASQAKSSVVASKRSELIMIIEMGGPDRSADGKSKNWRSLRKHYTPQHAVLTISLRGIGGISIGAYERILSFLVIILMIISALAPMGASAVAGNGTTDATIWQEIAPLSAPIRIDSDAELAGAATSGSGTIADPYIIENIAIDATGQYSGIFIGNTSAYLIIRNCTASGATGSYLDDLERGDAIMLYQCSNVLVEDCEGYGCTYGLDIFKSNNITAWNNTFHSLQYTGITVSDSHDIDLERNEMWSLASGLVSQFNSHDVLMRGNEVSGAINGISAYQSTYIDIDDNNCSGNSAYGILAESQSSHILVTNNTCNDNDYGICLGWISNNLIANNTVFDNDLEGIHLGGSTDNIVQNNVIGGLLCPYGIYMARSSNNRMSGNILSDMNNIGFYLDTSDHNIIENNTITNVFRHIYISGTGNDYNIISNNTCLGGTSSVFFYSSTASHNTIDNNLFTGFTNPAIYLSNDVYSYNRITNNTFRDIPWSSITIVSGTSNYVCGNVFINAGGIAPTCSDSGTDIWNSTEYGNYWHDHASPDADYDGIVDVPRPIDGGANVDNLPLVSPLIITDPLTDGMIVEESEIVLQGLLINHWDAVSFTWHNDATGESGNCTPGLEWNCTVSLTGGENGITVVMVDVGGRHFTDNITVISTLTTLTMDPVSGSTVYTRNGTIDVTLNITGYWPLVNATVEHSVNGETVGTWVNDSMAGQSSFEATWTLDIAEGHNYFLIYFRDANGGFMSGVIFAIRDNSAPVIAFTFPFEGGCISVDEMQVVWEVDDATEIVSQNYSLDSGAPIAIAGGSVTLSDLTEGDHTFRLNATDSCGNSASKTVNFTVDMTEPSLVITSPTNGTLLSESDVLITYIANDSVTHVEYVRYSLDQGEWSMTFTDSILLSDLPDGEHTVEIEAYDLPRNRNATSVSFTVDTTAPVVTITSPANGGYTTGGLVTWTVDDALDANLTEVSIDGANWTAVSGNSHTFDLADGTYTAYVRVTDMVGLVGTDEVTFTLDSVAPSLTITSPANGTYNNTGSVTVTWTSSDANGITKTEVRKDGGSWSVVTGQSITVTGLTDGARTISVRVTDAAGNSVTESVVVLVSTSGPSIELVPGGTVFTSEGGWDVTANVSDEVPMTSAFLRVYVDGEMVSEVDLTSNVLGENLASLAYTVELAEGVNVLRLTVNDSAGNTYTAEMTVVRDTIAPTLVIGFPAEGGLLNVTEGIAQWTASDDGSGLNNTWVRMDDDEWTELGTAEGWIFASLADGEHTLFVKVDDRVGNMIIVNVTFTVDSTAPTAEVSPTGNDVGADKVVVIEFSEPMNQSSVSVIVEGVTGETAWDGNVLTFTPSALEYASDYIVTVTGKDLAGNDMEMNWTFSTASPSGFITGTILGEDGEPLANVTVRAGDASAVTDELGRFLLDGLAAGDYLLTVDEDGYEPYTSNVTVTEGEASDVGQLSLVAVDTGEDGGGNTLMIVAAIAIIAVACAVLVVFIKRRT